MVKKNKIIVLAGGVGAAKFLDGLIRVIDPERLVIIVNTGDDIDLFGLKICPDLDIITYTLANLVDRDKGWGIEGETFNSLKFLEKFYETGWFNLGDKDLATHIFRTDLYNQGYSKSEITSIICKKLEVKSQIIPMCNEPVTTKIKTSSKNMHFEEYYIKYQCKPAIQGLSFEGIEQANPVDGVITEIENAEKIIICPSNPIVSIGTILQVKGIKEALKQSKEKGYAISPIIEGKTVKGPADKLLEFLGYEVSSKAVAELYKEILTHLVIDERDFFLKSKIEDLGLNCYLFDTLMNNIEKKKALAKFIMNL
ncbi:MAG: 2-phospho-L-lactate transferase [Promethearchaeota archaeon]|nr:MAG: 2-phospho-L-lactate transferase [Candidatus Lokiarchaeota archaeon]